MNETQRRALRNAIANAADDLARAKMQLKADPNYRTGNDISISEMVADYQRRYDELRQGIGGNGASRCVKCGHEVGR